MGLRDDRDVVRLPTIDEPRNSTAEYGDVHGADRYENVAAVRGRFPARRAREIVRAACGGRLPWRARGLLLALSCRGPWTWLRTVPRWFGRLGWAVRGGVGQR